MVCRRDPGSGRARAALSYIRPRAVKPGGGHHPGRLSFTAPALITPMSHRGKPDPLDLRRVRLRAPPAGGLHALHVERGGDLGPAHAHTGGPGNRADHLESEITAGCRRAWIQDWHRCHKV